MAINANRNLRINHAFQAKTIERLSSGFTINRAADDAAGLAISENLRFQVNGLQQASRNIQDGISLVQTAEGALQEIHAMLQRMNVMANQASNGVYSKSDRASIQAEFVQLNDEINNIMVSSNFNKIKLVNGDHSTGRQGNHSQIVGSKILSGVIQVDANNDTFNFDLDHGSFSISMGHGNFTASDFVNNINVQLQNNNIDLRATLVNGKLSFSHVLSGQFPIDNITGNGISHMLHAKQGTPASYVVAGEALLTPFVTITAGVNDVLNFEVEGIAHSITIAEGTYATHLHANPETSPLAMEINNKLVAQGIPIVAGYGGFVGTHPSLPGDIFSACLTLKGNVNEIGNFGGSARDALLGQLWSDELIDGTPTTMIGASNLSGGLEIIGGLNDHLEININGTVKFYSIPAGSYDAASLINELNSQLSADNIVATLQNGNLVLSQNNGYSVNVVGGKLAKELFFSYIEGQDVDELNQGIIIQTGVNAGDHLVLDMPDVSIISGDISSIDLTSAAGASNALATIEQAINQLSSERARMGAYQNRLEHTQNNVLNYSENLVASESRIRDADMAKEITRLSRAQIVSDAGQAMLAQANIHSQRILKLLM